MTQNKGDTLYIVLDYMVDGEPLETKQFDKMECEICLNPWNE